MHKKNTFSELDPAEEVQIGSLAHAYNLHDRTINAMIRAIGARFDNALIRDIAERFNNAPIRGSHADFDNDLINFKLFEGLEIRSNFIDYKLIHNDIHAFFLIRNNNPRQLVFDVLCDASFYCGSQVDYEKKWMQLRLLNDEKFLHIFENNGLKKDIPNDNFQLAEMFPTLCRPGFLSDDTDEIQSISEKIDSIYIETLSLAIRDLSYISLHDAIIFLEHNDILMIRENDLITFELKNRILDDELNKKIVFSPITRAAWYAGVEEYEKNHKKRKNDKVPGRVRMLLDKLGGMPFSVLEEKYRNEEKEINISEKLQEAREECVPLMRNIFPELPPLPKK